MKTEIGYFEQLLRVRLELNAPPCFTKEQKEKWVTDWLAEIAKELIEYTIVKHNENLPCDL
jgi:hypothetical protein